MWCQAFVNSGSASRVWEGADGEAGIVEEYVYLCLRFIETLLNPGISGTGTRY